MGDLARLFGFGGQQGPSAAEKAMQADRYQTANRREAEADHRLALASRANSLRRSLSFQDREKKGTIGG